MPAIGGGELIVSGCPLFAFLFFRIFCELLWLAAIGSGRELSDMGSERLPAMGSERLPAIGSER